jgi:apolipoprotein D and lipocalin family protein
MWAIGQRAGKRHRAPAALPPSESWLVEGLGGHLGVKPRPLAPRPARPLRCSTFTPAAPPVPGLSMRLPPLEAQTKVVDVQKLMGKWYVVAVIPNFIEKEGKVFNETEVYEWNEEKKRISVTMEYSKGSFEGPRTQLLQHGWVYNHETGSEWRVSPKISCCVLPVKLKYIIIDSADDYSHMTVGYPDRSLLWIMTREPNPAESKMESMIQACVAQGYDSTAIKQVPQRWTS